MEEWRLAFDQCSHFLGKPSGPISEFGKAELVPTTRRNIIASLVIKFEIMLLFKIHLVHHENDMEEWWANDQGSHFLGKPSGPISGFGWLSLLPPLGGTSLPPWSSSSRFCLFLKSIWFFHHENVMEEWWAYDQGSHFLRKPSGPISVFVSCACPSH